MEFYTYSPVLYMGILAATISGLLNYTKQKKYAKYFSFLSVLCLFIIFYVARGMDIYYDARNYDSVKSFDDIGTITFFLEWGWRLLCLLGNTLGMDFFTFRIVILSVLVFMLYRTFKPFSFSYGWVILVYMTYFMYVDIWQLQNTIGMCIFLIALRYVIYNDSPKNTWKFAVAILLAASVHTAYYVALIYLLLFVKRKKTIAKLLIGLELLLIVITYLNNNYIPIISTLMSLSSDSRVSGYASSSTRISWIVGAAELVVYSFCIGVICYNNTKKNDYYEQVLGQEDFLLFQRRTSFAKVVLLIDIISFLLVPMNMMISHMYRMIRNLELLQYLCIFTNYKYFGRNAIWKIVLLIGVVATVVAWRIFEFEYNTGYDFLVIPVLNGEYY